MHSTYTSLLAALAGFIWIAALVGIACAALIVVGKWKVLDKLDHKGWAAAVPVYGDWEMSCAVGMDRRLSIAIAASEGAFIVLSLIAGTNDFLSGLATLLSLASYALTWVLDYHVSQTFGKGIGWMFGLALAPVVFWPMLGLGDSAPAEKQEA